MQEIVRQPFMRASVAAAAPVGRLTPVVAAKGPVRRLHLNECPHPPSPGVIEAIRAAAGSVNRYPDAQAGELAAALAERTGVAVDRIVFGTGSEELLNLLGLVALDPGDEIVCTTPSFGRYAKSAQLAGAKAVRVPVLADGRNDIPGLLAAVTPKTRILYAALPNNPTGALDDAAKVERLIETAPSNLLLVVDEAYFEHAHYAGAPDVLAVLARRDGPWIVMRTFSKAYCLAGLRLGYALCSTSEVAGSLNRSRTAFNAGVLAQAAALAALKDEVHLAMVLESCAVERARLRDGCRALGLEPLPTVTNFMSIPVPVPAAQIVAGMQAQGILIGAWGDGARDDVIRISIGLPEDTDAVLQALGALLRS